MPSLEPESTPTSEPQERGATTGARIGRAMAIIFPILATLVFVVLWIYIAAAVFTDGQLLTDTWEWLSGLETIPAVVVWILILPIAVFLWAWQADLEPILMGLVMVGMVAWTGLALSGLVRAPFRSQD